MARPPKNQTLDLSKPVELTAGLIDQLVCPGTKGQAFLRDTKSPGLRVRVTAAGAKAFVFEAKLRGQTIRRTIGDVKSWAIDDARTEANRLRVTLDSGLDPRQLDRQALEDKAAEARAATEAAEAAAIEAQRNTVTAASAWTEYIEEGKRLGYTQRGPWSERHYADHVTMADPGGRPFKRGQGNTAAGPLHALLQMPLKDITPETVSSWLKEENVQRPARAALAFRLLRGFLNWCEESNDFTGIADSKAHHTTKVRRLVKRSSGKNDSIQREQLRPWFAAVLTERDIHARAYLLALLLTGARKGEVAGLRWEDLDLRFGGSLTIRDKVEGVRTIPCPPYLAQVLATLPRQCEWVFGADAPKMAHNATYNHKKALARAGLPHVSLHGLRRSFGSLAEQADAPNGVIAQIQGHKPSATAEKHYRVRPLDVLRDWHRRIEAWMLEQAAVHFDATAEPGKLRAVS